MKAQLQLAVAVAAVLGSTSLAWGQFGNPGHRQADQHRNFDHAAADYGIANNHYQRDYYRNAGHVQRDLYQYGTTNPYSSPGHFFGDQARQFSHYRTDQNRNIGHARRDSAIQYNHYRRDMYFGRGY